MINCYEPTCFNLKKDCTMTTCIYLDDVYHEKTSRIVNFCTLKCNVIAVNISKIVHTNDVIKT